jgi:large subunit ribosomal protein L7/L12
VRFVVSEKRMASLHRIPARFGRQVCHHRVSVMVSHHVVPSSFRVTARLSMSTSTSSAAATNVSSIGSSSSADASPSLSSPKLQSLYDKITSLPEEEANVLGALVIQVLGRKIFPGEFGRGLADGVVLSGAEEEEEAVEIKTSFDLKLVGFDSKAKIKVIKEVRAIAGLGLKEAKELVESAPKVIQKDLKQDKADELKAQLEAVGAQIEIV